MRRFVVPAALAALLATATVATAAPQMSTGTIKSVDLHGMTLVLADGTTYHLPKGFKDPGLKAGEKVQVSWNMQNGQYDATAVSIQK